VEGAVTLDDFRAAHPDFGFIAYAAFEPGAVVEVIRDGAVLEQVRGETFAAAVEDAVNVARLVVARELAIAARHRAQAGEMFGPPAEAGSIFD
jgi:hypothetical protein